MTSFLKRFFRVLPEETGKLALFSGLAALLQAGVAIGTTAADSLFLTHLGAEKLPVIYLGMPVLMVLYAPVYSTLVARLGADRLVPLTLFVLVVGGVAFGLGSAMVGEGTPWLLYAMKFYSGLWFIALYTLFWNFADDYFSILDGKRLYGFIAAGGAAGGTIGAAAVSWASSIAAPGRFFYAWAAVAAAAIPVFSLVRRRSTRLEADVPAEWVAAPTRRVIRDVFNTFHASRFAVSLAALCFCSVLLASGLEYLSLGVLAQHKTPAELAHLLGRLYAIGNILTLGISLLAYNRVVGWLGVGNTALILPLGFVAAFTGLHLHHGFSTAIVGLYTYQALLASIEYNNVNLLFNALPAAAKRPLRTFVEAMSEPLATAVAGGLLLVWAQTLGPANVALAGVCSAVLALTTAFFLRHDYAAALADNLRRDWLDFSPPSEHWRTLLTDPDRELLREKALHGRDRAERQLATELLGYTCDAAAGRALAALVATANPSEAERLRPVIGRILRGGETATVAELLLWLEGPQSPEDPALLDEFAAVGAIPLRHLPAWSRSAQPSRIAMAAIARWHGPRIEDEEGALADVRRLLAGGDDERRWGIRALGGFRHAQHAGELVRHLDENHGLRVEVLRALHKVANPDTTDVLPSVLPLLADAGPDERRLILGIVERVGAISSVEDVLLATRQFSAAENRQVESLVAGFGPRAIAMVIHVLRNPTASIRSRIVAARALARLSHAQLQLLAGELMSAELRRAGEFAKAADVLASTGDRAGDGSVVLRRFYRDSAAEAVDFVVHLLGLSGRLPEVDLILASLGFGTPKDHANAVEALEQSAPHALFRELRPLVGLAGGATGEHAVADASSRTLLLRQGAVSEHALECAAALLALREGQEPYAHELIRQRIDQAESPKVTAVLASLLPYFANEVAPGFRPLHAVERVAAFVRADYFAGARIGALEYLADRAEERRAPEREELYSHARPSPDLLIVARGEVELARGGARRRVHAGGTCNERALFGDSASDERAVSKGSTVLAVPSTTVARAIEIYPALGISLYRTKVVAPEAS